MVKRVTVAVVLVLAASVGSAQSKVYISKWADQPDAWFKSEEGQKLISNIIANQMPGGGWHKAYDTMVAAQKPEAPVEIPGPKPKNDGASTWERSGTIDNDATYTELKVLARAVRVTGRDDARKAFEKGMTFLLEMQYPNGGFPQRYPTSDNYGKFITYNDGAMIGALSVLKDAGEGKGDYGFVPEGDRPKYKAAVDKGIECLLKSQIVVDGTPTVWGQQHDDVTLAPTYARTYELPSFCSSESAGITWFLMGVEKPSPEVVKAVDSAVVWFEAHAIRGMKYERVPDESLPKKYDRYLVKDETPGAMVWARFYDLAEGKPMFVDRDGVPKRDVKEVGYERRTGYAWYSTSPAKVLKEYPKWRAKVGG